MHHSRALTEAVKSLALSNTEKYRGIAYQTSVNINGIIKQPVPRCALRGQHAIFFLYGYIRAVPTQREQSIVHAENTYRHAHTHNTDTPHLIQRLLCNRDITAAYQYTDYSIQFSKISVGRAKRRARSLV